MLRRGVKENMTDRVQMEKDDSRVASVRDVRSKGLSSEDKHREGSNGCSSNLLYRKVKSLTYKYGNMFLFYGRNRGVE